MFQVSWFVCLLAAKGSKTMPVLSTVEAQLSLHKRNIVSFPDVHRTEGIWERDYPKSTGMARNRRITTNKPRSEIALVLQYYVSHISFAASTTSQASLTRSRTMLLDISPKLVTNCKRASTHKLYSHQYREFYQVIFRR